MNYINIASRIMLALIFVLAGLDKVATFDMTLGYMESMGVPGLLLVPTIIFEIGLGIALIIGFQTRYAALLLAGFSLVSAVIFHADLNDPTQFVMFMKNIAMAGGLLLLFEHGAGHFSVDKKREQIK